MNKLFFDKNFIFLMLGKFISLTFTAIYDIALIWYVLSNFGVNSGKMLSLIMILGILPSVLLGGVIGSLADRYNKKKIIIISDFIASLVVLIVAVLMHKNMAGGIILLIATALLSIVSAQVSITVTSMLPELFSYDLYGVNSMNQLIERVTMLIGFGFGGVLISFIGIEKIFFLNAVSFMLAAFLELFLNYSHSKTMVCRENKKGSLINDLKEVYAYIVKNPKLLKFVLIFTLVNFFWDPLFNIVVPYVLKKVISVSPMEFGLLQCAPALGFCLTSIYLSKNNTLIKNKYFLFKAVMGANTVFLMYSLPIIFFTVLKLNNKVVYFMFILEIVIGFFSSVINIGASVTLQTLVPEEFRGKFFGVSRSVSAGLVPIGSAILGLLVGRINSSIFFIVCIVCVYVLIFTIPKSSYSLCAEEGMAQSAQI